MATAFNNSTTAVSGVGTLTALFKQVFSSKVLNTVPDTTYVQQKLPFVASNAPGRLWQVPVELAYPQGFTYAAARAGAVELESPKAADVEEAQVEGSNIVLSTSMDSESAERAKSSKQAFLQTAGIKTLSLRNAFRFRVELGSLYGRTNLGATSTSATWNAAATQVYTITAATWAPRIWPCMLGGYVDVYNSSNTKLNQEGLHVSSYSLANKTVTLKTDSAAAPGTSISVSSGDYIVPRGSKSSDMYGLDAIFSNSGSLYNIDAAANPLWLPGAYSVGSKACTVEEILAGADVAINGGGLSGKACFICSTATARSLNVDRTAAQIFDSSYTGDKAKMGSHGLMLNHAGVNIELVAHPMVKEGEAFLFPEGEGMRIGSSDIHFADDNGEIFIRLPYHDGVVWRARTNQTVFFPAPAKCVKYTGIVNPS